MTKKIIMDCDPGHDDAIAFKALLVFFSTDWLPATVVTAMISNGLCLAPASINAIASSWPGSQSSLKSYDIIL